MASNVKETKVRGALEVCLHEKKVEVIRPFAHGEVVDLDDD